MKHFFVLVILAFVFTNCNKDKGENVCGHQTFSFFDESGNDLFGVDNQNHIDTTALKAYFFSGEEVQVIYGEINGIYQFDIYLLELKNKAIVHIGDLAVDTLEYQFKEEGNSRFVHKVYYNGELVKTNEEPTNCGNGSVVDIIVQTDIN